jgi:dUTP pyrophosphatase
MTKFEVVSKYAAQGIHLPTRATTGAAGYDFEVAEDIIIPSYSDLMDTATVVGVLTTGTYSLDTIANLTKKYHIKPTLVPTGIKCKLDPNTYLQLSVRSSCPLKYWLVLANGVGVIDADYYNNPDNEGHIYFQIINFSPYNIRLQKGDKIGQGIILPYLTAEEEAPTEERKGGFGSTSAAGAIE